MEQTTVTMTAEQMAEWQAFQMAKAKQKEAEERKQALDAYRTMIDEQIECTIPELVSLSGELATVKRTVFDNFKALLDMKSDTLKMTKDNQKSHTFTSSDGKARIELGCYQLDNYDDTANDGIAMIKEWIQSKAKDAETQALVDMVMKLLSKDQKGTLKASRVLQLRNMAAQINDARFSEGVQIIMDAYRPIPSRQFIRAAVKGEDGEWEAIPLSITEAE